MELFISATFNYFRQFQKCCFLKYKTVNYFSPIRQWSYIVDEVVYISIHHFRIVRQVSEREFQQTTGIAEIYTESGMTERMYVHTNNVDLLAQCEVVAMNKQNV